MPQGYEQARRQLGVVHPSFCSTQRAASAALNCSNSCRRSGETDSAQTATCSVNNSITAWSLGWLGPPLPDLVSIVEPFLDDEEEMVRENAIRALARHEALPAATLARIVELTTDESASNRTEAAVALGDHGVKSEAVVAALMRGIEDEVKEVRMKSRMALPFFNMMHF